MHSLSIPFLRRTLPNASALLAVAARHSLRSYSSCNTPSSTTCDRPKMKIDHVGSVSDITHELVDLRLKTQGYAFFRGAMVTDPKKLQTLQRFFFRDVYDYMDNGGIYTATRTDKVHGVYEFVDVSTNFWDMPAHNDLAYRPKMVGRASIAQFRPADEGGITPVGDMRVIWVDLTKEYPDTMIELHKYGLIYYKNLPDANNTAKATQWLKTADIPSWQKNFPNMTKTEIEQLVISSGEKAEWHLDGTLRISWRIPAFRTHPETGEYFFCNQLLGFEARNFWQWPGRSFDHLPFIDQPTHVRIGNGRDLTDEEYLGILAIHKRHVMREQWQRGDVMVFDNVRMIHGREPYKGERMLAIMWGNAL